MTLLEVMIVIANPWVARIRSRCSGYGSAREQQG